MNKLYNHPVERFIQEVFNLHIINMNKTQPQSQEVHVCYTKTIEQTTYPIQTKIHKIRSELLPIAKNQLSYYFPATICDTLYYFASIDGIIFVFPRIRSRAKCYGWKKGNIEFYLRKNIETRFNLSRFQDWKTH